MSKLEVERCEGCGRALADDPGFPGALICPGCDADLLEGDATEGADGGELW